MWDTADDQSWPPTGAVKQTTTEASNYREITHLASQPLLAFLAVKCVGGGEGGSV